MVLGLIAAFVCVVPTSALAQELPASSGDVTVSYSHLRVPDGGARLPAGWLVSASHRMAGPLFVVGEVGGNYSFEDGDAQMFHTYQAGVRIAWSAPGTLPAYLQVLAGGATAVCCGYSATHLVFEPGFGFELPLSDRTLIRAGISFLLAPGDAAPPALYRGHVGIGFTFPDVRRTR